MNLVIRWLASAVALILVSYLLPWVSVDTFVTALIAALVIGLVNAFLGNILKILTLPLNLVTLGLVALIINALMFWLASQFVAGFVVTGVLGTFLSALIYGILAAFIANLFGAEKETL